MSRSIQEMKRWMSEVSLLGIPHFGEAAARLERIRASFLRCLDRPQDYRGGPYGSRVAVVPHASAAAEEVDACVTALHRLDVLVLRLQEVDPTFSSWQAAAREVCEVLEQVERIAGGEPERKIAN